MLQMVSDKDYCVILVRPCTEFAFSLKKTHIQEYGAQLPVLCTINSIHENEYCTAYSDRNIAMPCGSTVKLHHVHDETRQHPYFLIQ